MERIYCDISATTPVDPQVCIFLNKLNNNIYGNPSSIHREGQSAKAVIETSRRQLAKSLNSSTEEIIFTSNGSEANNMVLKGILNPGDHLITSSYEHPAIIKILPYLKTHNIESTLIKPDENGLIQPLRIQEEIKNNTRLISIMWVNNELGTINPIYDIGLIAKGMNILFHSDGVQAFGKIQIDVKKIPIDFISMSAHKLYGPKGVGALYKRVGQNIKPLIYGGGQESNIRAGTENIVGIGGFGLAAEIANDNLKKNVEHVLNLENYFIDILKKEKLLFKINGKNRMPGVFNITFYGINAQDLVMQLDLLGIGISNGSACGSGTIQASKMLLDLGLSNEEALSTVRISFGKIHTLEEIKIVAKTICNIASNNIKGNINNAG